MAFQKLDRQFGGPIDRAVLVKEIEQGQLQKHALGCQLGMAHHLFPVVVQADKAVQENHGAPRANRRDIGGNRYVRKAMQDHPPGLASLNLAD